MTKEKISLPKTVFLTGAGGAAVPGLIKLLQSKGYLVIAGDMDHNASGLYIADKGFVIPPGNSPQFFEKIKNISENEKVDIIVPLVDEELIALTKLEENGVSVLLPKENFISTCLDKFVLMQQLQKNGINVPRTQLANDNLESLSFPLIAKPRVGRGSRGIIVLTSKQELDAYLVTNSNNLNEILIQEYIEGIEYTVSVIAWRDGKVQAVVPKEVIHKKGITRMAITRRHSRIDELCRKIQNKLKADGPFNVQLRVNATGDPYVFEINPRFSTSISLTIAAGIDELNLLLEQALFKKKTEQLNDWEEGVVLLRNTLDEFISEEDYLSRLTDIRETEK